jgi:presequence protease
LQDLPRAAATIPTDVSSSSSGATFLTHDLFTSNVLYADVALPLQNVPARLLPLLDLFCRALTEMGTEQESFVELTERIDRSTGGISVSAMVEHKKGQKEPVALLLVRGKAMGDKAQVWQAIV